MESAEKFIVFYSKVRLYCIDCIENGVRRNVLVFLLKSKAIVHEFYRKWSQKKSS